MKLITLLMLLISSLYSIEDQIPANPFFISADQVIEITKNCKISTDELLKALVPIAKSYALAPISEYHVGVAALGKSGNIYLGVNLEFPGLPLNQSVHAEQFLLVNARNHGETELVAMALSAAPCGHCRQFMNELGSTSHFQLLLPDSQATTSELLPSSFGPKDLGFTGNLLSHEPRKATHSLSSSALEAAIASYAPYTLAKSGIALKTTDGSIFMGSYLENAAYNPSLSPLQSALINLVASKRAYDTIKEVILVEAENPKISQESISKEIIKSISPNATFKKEYLPY